MIRNCAIFWALLIAGCGVQSAREAARRVASDTTTKQTGLAVTSGSDTSGSETTGREFAGNAEGSVRKIIYEAEVKIVVHDFSKMENAVSQLVKEHGGYLANVSIDRTTGEQRSGRWQVRIPMDQFEAFLVAVSQLGVLESRSQTAQDVTEEYVDLEASITNKKRLEERILSLLEKSEGEIKDVIEIERELARVRGEIEQMEGRLRYLANRTALTTVVIVAREQRDYVPPESPTLLSRIRFAWGNSILLLRNVGEGIIVAVVFVFPWIIVFVIVVAPASWCLRRYKLLGNRSANSEQRRSPAAPDQPDG